jgi:hypothetical protein
MGGIMLAGGAFAAGLAGGVLDSAGLSAAVCVAMAGGGNLVLVGDTVIIACFFTLASSFVVCQRKYEMSFA